MLAERVGWDGWVSWFRENVGRLRPRHRRPDPADRLSWDPGDAAQCDLWFPPGRVPEEDGSTGLLPVLVMTAAHSRFTTGRMLPTRKTEDLLLGSWELIRWLGRVPRRLIWDTESGSGRGGRLADGVAAFTGTLATRIVQLRPRDPESKGIAGRRNGFFETSLMPGRAFASPADFNAQFTSWLERANGRVVRTLRARPSDLIEADRVAMLPLPVVPPPLGWQHQVRLAGTTTSARCQRLLRRSGRDRPGGRGDRRSGPGARLGRRAPGRRSCSALGPRDYHHRPGPCRGCPAPAAGVSPATQRSAGR